MNTNLHPIFQQALAPFSPPPATRPFRVEIKRGSLVQESFEVQGTDSVAVASEFRALVSPGQVLKITALAEVESASDD
jgi:hypothetical protein